MRQNGCSNKHIMGSRTCHSVAAAPHYFKIVSFVYVSLVSPISRLSVITDPLRLSAAGKMYMAGEWLRMEPGCIYIQRKEKFKWDSDGGSKIVVAYYSVTQCLQCVVTAEVEERQVDGGGGRHEKATES